MAAQSLPPRPDLEHLKSEARRLLTAYRDGDAAAREAFGAHPRAVTPDTAQLTDAQLALARGCGFDSWPQLRRHVVGSQLRRAIWERDADAVRRALRDDAGALTEVGAHPMFGGEPMALQVAAERGQAEVVGLLLDHGAAINDTGPYGATPLQLAVHWGHGDVVRLLLDRGAAVDLGAAILLDDAGAVTRLVEEDPACIDGPVMGGSTPLHLARSAAMARLLLERGAPTNTVDSWGNTPLGTAVGRGEAGNPVAEALLAAGIEADPCQLAALGNVPALQAVLARDPATTGFVGRIGLHAVDGTPLHAAVHAGRARAVDLLLERGAEVNARASAGQTPLHLCGEAAIARALVQAGADTGARDDEHGTTPLDWARVAIEIHGDTEPRRAVVEFLETVTQG